VETGECLKVLEGHTELIQSIALSANGRRVVSGSHDNTIRVWDSKTGECLKVLEGHAGCVQSLVLSAAGGRIVSGSSDNTLRVWDMESGGCLGAFFLRGQYSITLQSEGRKLFVGFSDGRVELYEIQNLSLGPLITTAHRAIISQDLPAGPVTARPPCCGQLIPIPDPISESIEHWNDKGGDGGYTALELLLDCHHCQTPLRMNPFFVNVVKSAN
jgi:WD40 repeat protein